MGNVLGKSQVMQSRTMQEQINSKLTSCSIIAQIGMKSQVVDSFWAHQSSEHLQSTTIIPSIAQSILSKKTLSKEQRFSSLMSIFQVAAELASVSISATESTTAEVNGIVAKLQLSTRDGGKKTKKGGDTSKNNAKLVPMSDYIANPPIKRNQSQACKQPSAIGAPTTSSYKAA
jgi:hypothetical protein